MYTRFILLRSWLAIFSIISLVAGPIFAYFMLTHNDHALSLVADWTGVPVCVSALLLLICRMLCIGNTKNTLSQSDDSNKVDALCMLALRADQYLPDCKDQMMDAAIQRLHKIEADYNTPVSLKEIQAINNILCRNNEELCIAALQVLSNIGNDESLRHVEKIVRNKKHQSTSVELQKVAEDCYTTLQQRIAQSNNPQVLLRPSAHTNVPDQLLRAVAGTAQATPEETVQLLRPTVGQDDAPNV